MSSPLLSMVSGLPVRRTPWRRGLLLFVVAWTPTGCAPPELDPAEVAAIQLAAATEIVKEIASNARSSVTMCLDYDDGKGEVAELPEAPSDSLRVVRMSDCKVVEGQALSPEDGSPALSVIVRVPERKSPWRATVAVMVSGAPFDATYYDCTVVPRDSSWRVKSCELDGIT